MVKDETGLSLSRGDAAALSRSDAVWLLHAGAAGGDGGVWLDGISVLHATENCRGVRLRRTGNAVPALL